MKNPIKTKGDKTMLVALVAFVILLALTFLLSPTHTKNSVITPSNAYSVKELKQIVSQSKSFLTTAGTFGFDWNNAIRQADSNNMNAKKLDMSVPPTLDKAGNDSVLTAAQTHSLLVQKAFYNTPITNINVLNLTINSRENVRNSEKLLKFVDFSEFKTAGQSNLSSLSDALNFSEFKVLPNTIKINTSNTKKDKNTSTNRKRATVYASWQSEYGRLINPPTDDYGRETYNIIGHNVNNLYYTNVKLVLEKFNTEGWKVVKISDSDISNHSWSKQAYGLVTTNGMSYSLAGDIMNRN